MKGRARSAVTNGTRLMPEVDGRTLWARRMRDLMNAHIADMGGDDAVSEAERSLARRAAAITTELERMESVFAQAGAADPEALDLYGRQAGTLKRILEGIGLRRRPKDVTPDLRSYLDQSQRPAA